VFQNVQAIMAIGGCNFFSTATMHTHGYAILEKGWGGGYGHKFKLVTKQDLVRWLSVPIRHGARDGSASSIPRRLMQTLMMLLPSI
jgi:hypothetical protein